MTQINQNLYVSGAGNGFPFSFVSPYVVEVSGFDDWCTLGGTTKASPTPTDYQLSLSLQNAWKMYWMGVRWSPWNSDVGYINDLPLTPNQPIDRICPEGEPDGWSLIYKAFRPTANLVRMLNGGEYVGIGLLNTSDDADPFERVLSYGFGTGINTTTGTGLPDTAVTLCSYGDIDLTTPTPSFDEAIDKAYIEVDGLHFLSIVYGRVSSGAPLTANALGGIIQADGDTVQSYRVPTVSRPYQAIEFYEPAS